MKPNIKVVSKKYLTKRFGTSQAVTVGSRIYVTPKTPLLALEHEKAHVRLGHKSGEKLNAYQYASRELHAEREAHNKLGTKLNTHRELNRLFTQTKEVFRKPLGRNPSREELRELNERVKRSVNSAARVQGIKRRLV